jgi:hypothetical protein
VGSIPIARSTSRLRLTRAIDRFQRESASAFHENAIWCGLNMRD